MNPIKTYAEVSTMISAALVARPGNGKTQLVAVRDAHGHYMFIVLDQKGRERHMLHADYTDQWRLNTHWAHFAGVDLRKPALPLRADPVDTDPRSNAEIFASIRRHLAVDLSKPALPARPGLAVARDYRTNEQIMMDAVAVVRAKRLSVERVASA